MNTKMQKSHMNTHMRPHSHSLDTKYRYKTKHLTEGRWGIILLPCHQLGTRSASQEGAPFRIQWSKALLSSPMGSSNRELVQLSPLYARNQHGSLEGVAQTTVLFHPRCLQKKRARLLGEAEAGNYIPSCLSVGARDASHYSHSQTRSLLFVPKHQNIRVSVNLGARCPHFTLQLK